MAELKAVADTILASASYCRVCSTPQPSLSHAFFLFVSTPHDLRIRIYHRPHLGDVGWAGFVHVATQRPQDHHYYLLLASISAIIRCVQDFGYKLHTHVATMTTPTGLGRGSLADPITPALLGYAVPRRR